MLFRQIFFNILSGIGDGNFTYLLRCSRGDHGSAAVSALRAHINDIICRFYHIQIVLNHYDRISALRQTP